MNTVFMTGGDGDIGTAIKQKFCANGYEVIAPTIAEMNLLSEDSLNHYLQSLPQEISIFVHCAGINFPKIVDEIEFRDLYNTLEINALSFYRIMKQLIPKFKYQGAGHVLAISSLYGSIARAGRFSYVASKHCLQGMIKTLAIELGPYNVLVNTLSPGFVDTQLTRQNNSEETIKRFADAIPVKRLATTDDIASVAYFLCSPENRYINGQDIVVDGGYLIGGFQK